MSRGKTDKIICFSFKHFLFTNPDIETLQRNKRRRGFTYKQIQQILVPMWNILICGKKQVKKVHKHVQVVL